MATRPTDGIDNRFRTEAMRTPETITYARYSLTFALMRSLCRLRNDAMENGNALSKIVAVVITEVAAFSTIIPALIEGLFREAISWLLLPFAACGLINDNEDSLYDMVKYGARWGLHSAYSSISLIFRNISCTTIDLPEGPNFRRDNDCWCFLDTMDALAEAERNRDRVDHHHHNRHVDHHHHHYHHDPYNDGRHPQRTVGHFPRVAPITTDVTGRTVVGSDTAGNGQRLSGQPLPPNTHLTGQTSIPVFRPYVPDHVPASLIPQTVYAPLPVYTSSVARQPEVRVGVGSANTGCTLSGTPPAPNAPPIRPTHAPIPAYSSPELPRRAEVGSDNTDSTLSGGPQRDRVG